MSFSTNELRESEAGNILDLENDFPEESKSLRLKCINESKRDAEFGPMAAAYKLAFPERAKDLVVNQKELRESLDKARKWGDLSNAVALKILFPDIDPGVTDEEVENQIQEALSARESSPDFFAQQLSDAKILSPKKVEGVLKKEDFQLMIGALDQMRKEGNWEKFARHASKVRILFPERNQDMGVTSEDVDKLNLLITGVMERPKTTQSTDLLAATKILASRDVNVPDEGGLELAI